MRPVFFTPVPVTAPMFLGVPAEPTMYKMRVRSVVTFAAPKSCSNTPFNCRGPWERVPYTQSKEQFAVELNRFLTNCNILASLQDRARHCHVRCKTFAWS